MVTAAYHHTLVVQFQPFLNGWMVQHCFLQQKKINVQLCPIHVDQSDGVNHIPLGQSHHLQVVDHFPWGKVVASFAPYKGFEALICIAYSLCRLHMVNMGMAKANYDVELFAFLANAMA